jgi:hypothetical protein
MTVIFSGGTECCCTSVSRASRLFATMCRTTVSERTNAAGNVFPVLLRRNLICGASLAIRSTCKPWILPMPEGAIHDEWTALVAAAHGSVRFVPKPLIRYRQHTSNQIGLLHLNWRRRFDTLIHRHGPEAKRRLGMMHRLRQRLMDTGAPSRTLEEVDGAIRPDAMLFGESQSRIVISLRRRNLNRLREIAGDAEVPMVVLGEVRGRRL